MTPHVAGERGAARLLQSLGQDVPAQDPRYTSSRRAFVSFIGSMMASPTTP